jgi:hypothetical protein
MCFDAFVMGSPKTEFSLFVVFLFIPSNIQARYVPALKSRGVAKLLGLWLCGVLAGGPISAPQPCNLDHASGQPTQLSKNTYRTRHLTRALLSAESDLVVAGLVLSHPI